VLRPADGRRQNEYEHRDPDGRQGDDEQTPSPAHSR